MFGVPLARIRVVVPHLGGGFGSKTYAKLEPLAAALARAAGRPVRLAASVAEAFQTVRRCAAMVRVRVGFRRDGGLVAVECDADYDVGAYADIGPRVVQKATYTATGPYRVANVRLDARAVYTNTTPGGAFRGFGVPQLVWALESLFDVAAERLGRDPGGAAAAELSRPRRGVRARRHAHRRQARGKSRARRRGDRLDAGRRRRPRARRRRDAQGLGRAERVGGDRAVAHRRERHRAGERRRDGAGNADRARADRRRGAERAHGPRARRPARHCRHAVRPDHQLEPLDCDDRPRRAGRGRGRARAASPRGRRRARHRREGSGAGRRLGRRRRRGVSRTPRC